MFPIPALRLLFIVISENKLTAHFPDWIGKLTQLANLRLKCASLLLSQA